MGFDILGDSLLHIEYLLLHPMLYFGILIIALQYRRQIDLERKLFSSRIHFLPREVLASIGYGLIGGLIASFFILALGIVFHPTDMLFVWLITGILVLFHIRFLCLSYSVGILGVTAGVLQLFRVNIENLLQSMNLEWLTQFIEAILNINIPSLLAIVAILHMVEAILIKLQAGKQATPLFIETKRGRLVGGYHIQSFWMMPLFLVVYVGDGSTLPLFGASWWPLIGGGIGALSIIPVPTMIGYSDLTTVYSSQEKSNQAFKALLLYSSILLLLAFIAEHIVAIQLAAAIFAGLGHELVRYWGKRKEEDLPAKYVHPDDGLKILAVLPGSLAEKMGILDGEVIKKVNGIPVKTKQELYHALQHQSAFVKLELLNHDGHIKFAQHSVYDGDHHQLGILLAPDEKAPYYIEVNDLSLFKLLSQKVQKISRGA